MSYPPTSSQKEGIYGLCCVWTASSATLFARGTLCFEWKVIAVFGTCAIAQGTLGGMRLIQMQFFACWTQVDIALGFIAEAICTKELGAMVVIGQRDIGTDALVFEGDNLDTSSFWLSTCSASSAGCSASSSNRWVRGASTAKRGVSVSSEAFAFNLVASMYSSFPQTSPAS